MRVLLSARTLLAALVAIGCAAALPGRGLAQSQNDFSVTAQSPGANFLNLLTPEQRDRIGRGLNSQIELSWSTTARPTLSYRLSYDNEDIRGTPSDLVPTVLGVPNQGTVGGGAQPFFVSEQTLLERALSSTVGQTTTDVRQLPVYIVVFAPDDNPDPQSSTFESDAWNFQYDVVGPEPPAVRNVEPGERTIGVRWAIPPASDLQFFEVRYCTGLTEDDLQAFDPVEADDLSGVGRVLQLRELPCRADEQRIESQIRETEEVFTLSDGVVEGRWVAFSILSQDQTPFLNFTPPEERRVYAVATQSFDDFFELQDELGGNEDGGFCFVATAAYGSYAHPVVWILRQFRDHVLLPLPGGSALVDLYYRTSPPIAQAIRRSPALAAGVRVALVGLVIALALAPILVVILLRRGLRRFVRGAAVGALILAGVAADPSVAGAQIRGDAEGDVGYGFEFKIGPYRPAIGDGVEEGGLRAWDEVYGAGNTRASFNLGTELQFYRGAIGTFSVGASAGLAVWPGNAQLRLVPDGNENTPDVVDAPRGTSTFNLIPMTLTLGYRFDGLMDWTPLPIAPYVRGGLAYTLWWNTRDDGRDRKSVV